MAQLRIVSDLHLEAFYGSDVTELANRFVPIDARDSLSILILAGDISSKPDQLVQFIAEIEQRFKQVVFVPGNHEYYKHDMVKLEPLLEKSLQEKTSRTIFSIGKISAAKFDGVRFIYGTAWTDGGADYWENDRVESGMSDFYVIKHDGEPFTVQKMQLIHRSMRKQIEAFLEKDNSKLPNVVVTHHLPSRRLCHPRFGGQIDGGFAFNGDAILASDYAPKVWIHGHTHDSIDTKVYNTRVVCNPRGYNKEHSFDVNHQFNSYELAPKFIEV